MSPNLRYGWLLLGVLVVPLAFVRPAASEEIVLKIQPHRFPAPSSVDLVVSAERLGRSQDSSTLSGQIRLNVQPSLVLPETVQVVAMDLIVDEALSFRLAGGLIRASTGANGVQFQLLNPSPPGEIAEGLFDQTGMALTASGMIQVSAQSDPIDLSQQPPATININGARLARTGRQLSLHNEIHATYETPIDAGIFGTIDLAFDISGGVLALGEIPTAVTVFSPDVGRLGNGQHWNQSENWVRGNVVDFGPLHDDPVKFPLGKATVELTDAVQIGNLEVEGDYTLGRTSPTLVPELLIGGSIIIQPDASLSIDTKLSRVPGSATPISVQGGGDLWVNHQAGNLRIESGRIGGVGKMNDLRIEAGGTLVGLVRSTAPGEVQTPLQIVGQLELRGNFQVEPQLNSLDMPTRRGETIEYDMITAGSILNNSTSVYYNQQLLTPVPHQAGVYRSEAGQGLFRTVVISTSGVQLINDWMDIGDADGDHSVSFSDFLRLSSSFSNSGGWEQGDFNSSGAVDFSDFLLLSDNFGHVRSASGRIEGVPEPFPIRSDIWSVTLLGALLKSTIARRSNRSRTRPN